MQQNILQELPACQAYPPVPNWYTSHCATVSDPHYYIYATRNTIVVLDLSSFRFVRAFIASKDKIQAITAYEQFCFVGGTDNMVRAWSLSNGSLLKTYEGHTTEITVIKCIRKGMVIISGDKSGKIILQESFQKKSRHIIKNVNSEVRTIEPLEHVGDDYLAIGYANGMIHIEKILIDLKTETLYQLNYPDGDGIHSLSWQLSSPTYPDIFPLLASSTRKLKNAIIWNVPEETRYSELKLPPPSPHWTDQQRNSVWFELAWSRLKEDEIYVTSYLGMIVQYRLDGRKVKEEARFRELHSRIAFSFIWVQQGRYAVTYSIDKQIILWDIKKRDAICRMWTQSGFLYSLDIPTWNPGQAAIGLGDSNIKIWNFMDTSGLKGQRHNFYQSQVLWRGLQGQILNVRWHPTRENILAYSTEYGRVGIYDTANNKNTSFKTYFNTKGLVSIHWAFDIQFDIDQGKEGDITINNNNMKFVRDCIIACSTQGLVYAYDTKQPNTKPIQVNQLIRQVNPAWSATLEAKVKTSRCCSAIDPHSRYLALGNTDGIVEVYRLDNFKIIYVASSQQVAVTKLAWNDISGSILLAVGYKFGTITIHSIVDSLNDSDTISKVPIPDTSPMQTITVHKKEITSLEWSHHQHQSLLASASKDESAYVFDVQNGTPLAYFDQHRGGVLSICWGIEDMDTLFTGGEDKFCYVWKYTDYPYNASTVQKNKKSRRVREIQVIDSSLNTIQQQSKRPDSPSLSTTSESNNKRRKIIPATASSSSSFPLSSTTTSSLGVGGAGTIKLNNLMNGLKRSSNIVGQPQLLRQCMEIAARIYGGDIDEAIKTVKDRIPTNIDPIEYEYVSYMDPTSSSNNNTTTDTREENVKDDEESNKIISLFFGDKNSMKELVNIEVNNANSTKQSGLAETDYYGQLLLEIMSSNYKAFESSPVNWITLALSPMASKQTWLDLMEKQANYLVKQNHIVLAATCFLACSKVYDAIRVYQEANMYREAIALAKLRLPAIDPIIPKLFAEWGDKLQKESTQEELAAMCFLNAKLPGSSVNAINLLIRRKKESYTFWAACLAVLLKEDTAEERILYYLQMLNDRLTKKQQQQQHQQ